MEEIKNGGKLSDIDGLDCSVRVGPDGDREVSSFCGSGSIVAGTASTLETRITSFFDLKRFQRTKSTREAKIIPIVKMKFNICMKLKKLSSFNREKIKRKKFFHGIPPKTPRITEKIIRK